MKILADLSLPNLKEAFPEPFALHFYQDVDELVSLLSDKQILVCRASLKVDETLLARAAKSLRYVATASSGSDHIDHNYLKDNKIDLLDARGANANAVADYVLASLAYLQKYQGFSAIKAGVIGIGHVGSRVVKRLKAAGMEVSAYDPLKAMVDSNFNSCSLVDLFDADLICIHANLHENPPFPSKNLIDASFLAQLKTGTTLINASRGGIVDERALIRELPRLRYCTDVYTQEPFINKKLVDLASLCTPHIAGHSLEAKQRAVSILSESLHKRFKLPSPIRSNSTPSPALPKNTNWQDLILALYNPNIETNLLKASSDLAQSFQDLRKAHQNRHDFCCYAGTINNKQLQELLGQT